MITNLMTIRQGHKLTTRQIADQAGLPQRTVYQAEIGWWTEPEDADKIAKALSLLAKESYRIEDFGLILKLKTLEDQPTQRQPANFYPR